MGVEESGETNWDTTIVICDNDEQLIPRTPNRSKSLYGGNDDIDNDPADLVPRKPKPHSQCVARIHGEKDRTMLLPESQRKKNSLKPKTTSDDPKYINEYQTSTIILFYFILFYYYYYYYYYYFAPNNQSQPNATLSQSNQKNLKSQTQMVSSN